MGTAALTRATARLAVTCCLLALSGHAGSALAQADAAPPSAEEATQFVQEAETALLARNRAQQRANWIYNNFITSDTEALAGAENDLQRQLAMQYARTARTFDAVTVDAETRRKLDLLKRGADLPPPADPTQAAALSNLASTLEGQYGSGTVCAQPGRDCRHLDELEETLAHSRDPAELLRVWDGWHRTARRYRDQYGDMVSLANQGTREFGEADLGAHWRGNYDMPEDAFAAEMERLWLQLEPLYRSLHTYVRHRLVAQYGQAAMTPDGTIPAHLLGNMWAQTWDNIFPLLDAPPGNPDLTPTLVRKGLDARGVVRTAEGFFTSLGFAPLPETFWQRSLFERPRDRDVVCHASAWDLDFDQDLRLKMCIRINEENFVVAHHELGHNFYQRAYADQPPLFRDSANDGFHEAIGDTIALSVTPEYLKKVGLLDKVPGPEADIALLLHRALEKVAFLPFAYAVDQWRWKVFAGEVGPEGYDALWWSLRTRYQGVSRPLPAEPGGFDAGAKYHVAASVPYARYFLADVLQFQFHRALCHEAGYQGPLHRCSIYGNAAAGNKLRAMLAMGASRPWQEALKTMTGEETMDASAIVDYFAPLKVWLDQRNAAYERANPPAREKKPQ